VSLFSWPARVYWEDTDGGGIVYYANYLRFLERARTEWLRSLGYSQHALSAQAGILFTVVSLSVDYRLPAKLDDELTVTCQPEAEGAVTVRFAQRIYREECLLVEASVRVACIDARTLRPKRLPDFLSNAVPGPGLAPGGARPTDHEGALLNG
jgi:acyl-CoA thioester hydrolase